MSVGQIVGIERMEGIPVPSDAGVGVPVAVIEGAGLGVPVGVRAGTLVGVMGGPAVEVGVGNSVWSIEGVVVKVGKAVGEIFNPDSISLPQLTPMITKTMPKAIFIGN